MICTVDGADLLLIHDWQVSRVLKDPQISNYKTWIETLPGFDSNVFPFLVCNGKGSINLINIRDNQMQTFIQSPCEVERQAFFFLPDQFGFSMHFCTKETTEHSKDIHHWHSMSCKQDFLERLMVHGCLPVVSLDSHYQMIDRVVMQSRQITMLKSTVEQTNHVYKKTLEEHEEWMTDQSQAMELMKKTVSAQMSINAELNLKIVELEKALEQANSETGNKNAKEQEENKEDGNE